jgi:hypothetical protein
VRSSAVVAAAAQGFLNMLATMKRQAAALGGGETAAAR